MKYDIEFSIEAKEDIERLKKSGDKKLLKKLFVIVTELKEHPNWYRKTRDAETLQNAHLEQKIVRKTQSSV